MEIVQHLQQTSCITFHHTLIMLLRYFGKLRKVHICCKYRTDCKLALIFACTHFDRSHLLTYYLLTYYFSSCFLLNILLNNAQFYVNRSKCWQPPLRIGHVTLYNFSRRLHLLHWTRSGATKQLRPQSGSLRDMRCHPAASFFSCECITLTNRSCTGWTFGVVWTTSSLTMQPSTYSACVWANIDT